MLPGKLGGVAWAALSASSGLSASSAVITWLIDLGDLQPGARHRATAVETARDRLRSDLIRQGVIRHGTLLSSPKNEDQPGLLGTQIGNRGGLSMPDIEPLATPKPEPEDFAERLERAIARSGVKLPRTFEADALPLPD